MENHKRIFIIESVSDAERLAQERITEEDIAVSFSVPAKIALDKNRIHSCYPDELVELPDLNGIGRENIGRVKSICSMIDDKLCGKFEFLSENNMQIFSASHYFIKLFFDTAYTSYIILKKLLCVLNFSEITVVKNKYRLAGLINGSENITAALIEHVFAHKMRNIRFIACGKNNFNEVMLIRLKGIVKYMKRFFTSGNGRYSQRGLILHNIHDTPYLLSSILKDIDFYRLYAASDGFLKIDSIRCLKNGSGIKADRSNHYISLIKESFVELARDEQFRSFFGDDEAFFDFARNSIQDYAIESLGIILPHADYIKNRIIELNPKILVTSACRLNLTDSFMLNLARSLKVPVITYQEGGGTGYLDWPMFELDSEFSDYFLVYGKGVQESPFIRGKAKVVPVGSIRLEDIKKKIKPNPRPQAEVYFVPDIFKMGIWQHYPYNGGFFSQAYSNQVKIIEMLKQFSKMKFVIKTIKSREFLYRRFVKKGFIRICTKPLAEVLAGAVAFILDAPSTVLQECLLTDKPVALLYSRDRYYIEKIALELLNKRVRVCSDVESYPRTISLLAEDITSANPVDTKNEFLEKYCLMENVEQNLKYFFQNQLQSDTIMYSSKRRLKQQECPVTVSRII